MIMWTNKRQGKHRWKQEFSSWLSYKTASFSITQLFQEKLELLSKERREVKNKLDCNRLEEALQIMYSSVVSVLSALFFFKLLTYTVTIPIR